jgi:dihydrofolate reductase
VDFDAGPEANRFKLEQAQNAEALLLGRVTYEAMQAFWPTAEGEFADRLNELPNYVVSSTLTDPPWNATLLGDDWPQEVARLRKELDGEILVYGSRRLSRALIGMGLVEELRLLVYPVVLGAGDRLFGETQDKIPLRLVGSRPFGGGVVSMIYAPAMAASSTRSLDPDSGETHANRPRADARADVAPTRPAIPYLSRMTSKTEG